MRMLRRRHAADLSSRGRRKSCGNRSSSSLLHVLLALLLWTVIGLDVASGSVSSDERLKAADMHHVYFAEEEGLVLVLASPEEHCRNACSITGSVCTFESLQSGAKYGTRWAINKTATHLGANCLWVAEGQHSEKGFPAIDGRGHCYGAPRFKRNNYDCDAISTLDSGTRRLCSCSSSGIITPPNGGDAQQQQAPTQTPPKDDDSRSEYIPNGFSLSWRDDFNGETLDTNSWSNGLVYDVDPTQHIVWNTKEGGPRLLNSLYDGYILDRNVIVRDGVLMLANREEQTPIEGTEPSGTFRFTSGWINSLRKRYFNGSEKSVYLETRVDFPSGPKVWPAIWLVAEEHVWPPEIDIWEYFGNYYQSPDKADEMHLRNIWGHYKNKTADVVVLEDFKADYPGYRTLGWLWTSDKMVWYVDGVEVCTKVRGSGDDDIPEAGWPEQDMSLIMNNGLMAAVDEVGTTFPNYLMIDYIALYTESPATDEPTVAPTVQPTVEPTVAFVSAVPSSSGSKWPIESERPSPGYSIDSLPTDTPTSADDLPTNTPDSDATSEACHVHSFVWWSTGFALLTAYFLGYRW